MFWKLEQQICFQSDSLRVTGCVSMPQDITLSQYNNIRWDSQKQIKRKYSKIKKKTENIKN